MRLRRDQAIWRGYPELVPGVTSVEGIRPDVEGRVAAYEDIAWAKLSSTTESDLLQSRA